MTTMQETYVTFGVQYKEQPSPYEERHPLGMFGTGYATIQAPDRDAARAIAVALFGDKWAFDYPEKPAFVTEEILRVAVIQRLQLQQLRELLDQAHEAADGGSNDEEIDALTDLRDAVAELIGYVR